MRKYLSQKYVVQEEDLLERIADSSEKGGSESLRSHATQTGFVLDT